MLDRLGTLAVLLALSLFIQAADAAFPQTFPQPYAVASFGTADLRSNSTDDLWSQFGFQRQSAQSSNAWRVGVGLKFNRWVSAEFDYRDLGQYNSAALFVKDDGSPGSYNVHTKTCNGPCAPSIMGWQHGVTAGLGLSLVAAPDWEVAPMARLGLFLHRSEFFTSQFHSVTPQATQLSTSTQDVGANAAPFSDTGLGWMFGVGLRARFLELEYTYYPKAGGPLSPYSNISSILLTMRFDL